MIKIYQLTEQERREKRREERREKKRRSRSRNPEGRSKPTTDVKGILMTILHIFFQNFCIRSNIIFSMQ